MPLTVCSLNKYVRREYCQVLVEAKKNEKIFVEIKDNGMGPNEELNEEFQKYMNYFEGHYIGKRNN